MGAGRVGATMDDRRGAGGNASHVDGKPEDCPRMEGEFIDPLGT